MEYILIKCLKISRMALVGRWPALRKHPSRGHGCRVTAAKASRPGSQDIGVYPDSRLFRNGPAFNLAESRNLHLHFIAVMETLARNQALVGGKHSQIWYGVVSLKRADVSPQDCGRMTALRDSPGF